MPGTVVTMQKLVHSMFVNVVEAKQIRGRDAVRVRLGCMSDPEVSDVSIEISQARAAELGLLH